MRTNRLLWSMPAALALAACSDGKPVDLGHAQAQLADYAASWDGYAEAYTFAEGTSDRVRIFLNATGVGTIEVGEAALDPVPTDPEVGLPGVPARFHDGFRYPIRAATVESGRIRFEVDPGERYASWCAIQTPVANELYATGYACVVIPPGKSYTPKELTGECTLWDQITQAGGGNQLVNPMPVSCSRWEPCIFEVCSCTASACAFNPAAPRAFGYRVRVDGALDDDGSSLVGTLAIHADWDNPDVADRVTIRLERQ